MSTPACNKCTAVAHAVGVQTLGCKRGPLSLSTGAMFLQDIANPEPGKMLSGHLPFDQNQPTFMQMLAKVEGHMLDPQSFSPLITEPMKCALLLGLNRDPLQRPRSAGEFIRLLCGAGPKASAAPPTQSSPGNRIFVSYSHHDSAWLDRLRVHLRPLEREQRIELWDDTRIRPGQDWRAEIENALESAACAVLLVSPDFLASDFCSLEEVPRLLRAARARGVTILSVILSPCRFQETPGISAFQAVNPPSRTLSEMAEPERDRTLVRLAEAVHQALDGKHGV